MSSSGCESLRLVLRGRGARGTVMDCFGGECSQGKRGKMWTVKSNERMVMSDDGQAMIERRDEQLTIKPGLGRRYARWLDCWMEEESRCAEISAGLTPSA